MSDMNTINFTDKLPGVGAYWWRKSAQGTPFLLEVSYSAGELMAHGDAIHLPVKIMEGQWSERLLPASCVEDAWKEGYACGMDSVTDKHKEENYQISTARTLIKGTGV